MTPPLPLRDRESAREIFRNEDAERPFVVLDITRGSIPGRAGGRAQRLVRMAKWNHTAQHWTWIDFPRSFARKIVDAMAKEL